VCLKLGFICCFLGIVGLLRVEKLVDANYSRGWDDCLEAVCLIMAKAQSIEEAKKKIDKLRGLIREDKFERIRYELGAFDLF
jgi:hypothetical protein